MTTTQLLNHAYNVICVLLAVYAALPIGALEVIPPAWKPYVVGTAGALLWIKSHWNLFVNPDGTDAKAPYIPAAK